MARGGNGCALPVAGRAGRNLHHRTQDGLAHLPHLARPVAGCAACGRSARLGAYPLAGRADFIAGEFHFALHAEHCLFKAELQLHLQVGPAPRHVTRALRRAPKAAEVEEFFEYIGEVHGEIRHTARALHASMAKAVVSGAFIVIAQNAVSLVDLFEALFGVGLLAHVRVILARQPPESPFDVIGGGFPV
jgi:hypothetical protein